MPRTLKSGSVYQHFVWVISRTSTSLKEYLVDGPTCIPEWKSDDFSALKYWDTQNAAERALAGYLDSIEDPDSEKYFYQVEAVLDTSSYKAVQDHLNEAILGEIIKLVKVTKGCAPVTKKFGNLIAPRTVSIIRDRYMLFVRAGFGNFNKEKFINELRYRKNQRRKNRNAAR